MSALPTVTHSYHLVGKGIDTLRIEQAKVEPPRSGEVLVKIHAVSIQSRDLAIAKGTYIAGVAPNVISCSDCAGEVIAVGASVCGFEPGDRVCANFNPEHIYGEITSLEQQMSAFGARVDGVLTEYRTFPAYCLVKFPEHLSYEEASTLPCAALTAYNCLYGPEPVKGGDIILTQGTGGVSIFAVHIAKAIGASVIATTSSSEKAKVLQKLGADHVINYKDTPDWDQEVQRITDGRGVDHIIEVGGPGTIGKSLGAVKIAGWIHLVGFVARGKEDSKILVKTFLKSAKLHGVVVGSKTLFEQMNRLLIATQMRPIVDRVFGFKDYPKALRYLESQQHVGKIVVRVQGAVGDDEKRERILACKL